MITPSQLVKSRIDMDETFQMSKPKSQRVVALVDEEVKPREKGGKSRDSVAFVAAVYTDGIAAAPAYIFTGQDLRLIVACRRHREDNVHDVRKWLSRRCTCPCVARTDSSLISTQSE